MIKNVGTLDRILRAALGLALLCLGPLSGLPAFEAGLLKYGAIIVGVVMLGVATMRACPLYAIFGITTCRA